MQEYYPLSPHLSFLQEWGNISSDAKSLISRLLERDTEKRLSASEVLSQPWLEQVGLRYLYNDYSCTCVCVCAHAVLFLSSKVAFQKMTDLLRILENSFSECC